MLRQKQSVRSRGSVFEQELEKNEIFRGSRLLQKAGYPIISPMSLTEKDTIRYGSII